MFPSIAIARFSLFDSNLEGAEAILQEVGVRSLMSSKGETLSVWRDVEQYGMYLAIATSLEESTQRHAWDSLEDLVADPARYENVFPAADIHPVLPHRIHGLQAKKAEIGHYVSVSTRRADPGRGEDLLEEMMGIFDSLKYLDGYLGSAIGPSAALEEEIVGIVFWSDQDAFESSGPRKGLYEIRLYERVL